MTFAPMLPLGGYTGWRFLQRTLDAQQTAFRASPALSRELTHFRENISRVNTADDLVSDRALLKVALGAFGLDDDIGNTAFIRKILDEGTSDGALANKLADKRYQAFTSAFGLGKNDFPQTWRQGFADKIIDRYESRQFEISVGEVDPDMRLALNLQSGLDDIIKDGGSNTALWFRTMGTPPVRSVFETAMGFPKSFGSLDIEQQREQFEDRAKSLFGTDDIRELAKPESREKMIRLFLTRSQLGSIDPAISQAQTALTLVSAIQIPKVSLF